MIFQFIIIAFNALMTSCQEVTENAKAIPSAVTTEPNSKISTTPVSYFAPWDTAKTQWLENEDTKFDNKTLTLGYLIPWTKDWEVGPTMGAAILLGLREIERQQLLPGYKVSKCPLSLIFI